MLPLVSVTTLSISFHPLLSCSSCILCISLSFTFSNVNPRFSSCITVFMFECFLIWGAALTFNISKNIEFEMLVVEFYTSCWANRLWTNSPENRSKLSLSVLLFCICRKILSDSSTHSTCYSRQGCSRGRRKTGHFRETFKFSVPIEQDFRSPLYLFLSSLCPSLSKSCWEEEG